MSGRFRKLIAGSEIAGGVAMMLVTATSAVLSPGRPWWYVPLAESLGVLSIAAGYWLWRNDRRGVVLSRPLQALQIIHVQAGGLAVGVLAGFQLLVSMSPTTFSIAPGFYGSLTLAWAIEAPWRVAVNLFAAAAFVALLRAPANDRDDLAPLWTEEAPASLLNASSDLPAGSRPTA